MSFFLASIDFQLGAELGQILTLIYRESEQFLHDYTKLVERMSLTQNFSASIEVITIIIMNHHENCQQHQHNHMDLMMNS